MGADANGQGKYTAAIDMHRIISADAIKRNTLDAVHSQYKAARLISG